MGSRGSSSSSRVVNTSRRETIPEPLPQTTKSIRQQIHDNQSDTSTYAEDRVTGRTLSVESFGKKHYVYIRNKNRSKFGEPPKRVVKEFKSQKDANEYVVKYMSQAGRSWYKKKEKEYFGEQE